MIGLTVLSEAAGRDCTASQAADVVDYFDTDVLYVRSAERDRSMREAVPDSVTVARYDPQSPTAEVLAADSEMTLVAATSVAELRTYASERLSGRKDATTFVLSDLLTVSLDLTRLEAELAGLEAYREALDEAADRTVQLTTGAVPSYRREWDGLVVQGVMPEASEGGGDSSADVAHAALRPDGTVRTETRSLGTFGLEAIADVGRRRAETLRDEGFDSRAELADATPHDLARLEGIGRPTARTIVESATVLETGEARVAPNASLPSGEPIFVDIETDGLDPSIVWLIGALDRSADGYGSFLETDPSRPAGAIEAFLGWLADVDPGRPVVAYNGRNFDFPIVEDHVAKHCPEHAETWASLPKFDPYRWAVERDNAVLPGLTNALEDVASALGWESDETGLSGAVVGRRYRRYAETPERELDWERHERYCEDDVRALAFVYDRLEEAQPLERAEEDDRSEPTTSQGTLADF
ncbi:ribonuclease H-like domain-containing protein [Natronococcus sp.]|uniref:ribonuclease H-like domain-containing protein n=1 Tax=Natronococcus sp. TaxID=35747 RepID=UPI003A4D650C